MEDSEIVQLFWERDETAVAAVSQKYGKYCTAIARNILEDEQAAEECANDTLLRLWETIPPNRPANLFAFIGKVARNIALNTRKSLRAQRRGGGEITLLLDELDTLVSSGISVEGAAEEKELLSAVNAFLEKLPEKNCRIFVLRYWSCCTVPEIAARVGASEGSVTMTLSRVRKKLAEYLKKGGY